MGLYRRLNKKEELRKKRNMGERAASNMISANASQREPYEKTGGRLRSQAPPNATLGSGSSRTGASTAGPMSHGKTTSIEIGK
jgi:hypothetical protein